MMSSKITDAKGNVHYVGNKRLVDLETGEEFNAQTIVKSIGDNDFKKLFLSEIIEKIEGFTNAKMKFMFWFLENADKQNRIIGTYEQLSEKTGISYPTISRVIPLLKKSDIIRCISPSVYMLNPDLVAAVTSTSRANLLIKYKALPSENEE